ncbi:hypothetical protein JCM10207_007957 [Rhodosporidiobolus poonsookiae]
MSTYRGKCLCGKSEILIDGPKVDSQIRCHCSDCVKTSGTAFSSNILIKETDVRFVGRIAKYVSKAASGNDVTRIFCGNCGAALGHNTVAFGDSLAVQTGVLGFKNVPYGVELFAKDRWADVAPSSTAQSFETVPPADPEPKSKL